MLSEESCFVFIVFLIYQINIHKTLRHYHTKQDAQNSVRYERQGVILVASNRGQFEMGKSSDETRLTIQTERSKLMRAPQYSPRTGLWGMISVTKHHFSTSHGSFFIVLKLKNYKKNARERLYLFFVKFAKMLTMSSNYRDREVSSHVQLRYLNFLDFHLIFCICLIRDFFKESCFIRKEYSAVQKTKKV